MAIDTAEQYKSDKYQRTAELERKFQMGMTIEEVYKKEADFALRSLGKDFLHPGDKVLDLACGEGHHANIVRDATGANIDARDVSEAAIQRAQTREITKQQNDVRGQINFAVGDMGHLDSLPAGTRYKAVTILGSSFMYLGTPETHEQAIRNFRERLDDGGKIVFQFRDRGNRQIDPVKRKEWCDRLGVQYEQRKAEGPTGNFGKFAKPDEEVTVVHDATQKDGFYWYKVSPTEAEGLDDVKREAWGKAYIHPDGREEDMGNTEVLNYMSEEGARPLVRMLERAGFSRDKIKLNSEPFSEDGIWQNYTLVAER